MSKGTSAPTKQPKRNASRAKNTESEIKIVSEMEPEVSASPPVPVSSSGASNTRWKEIADSVQRNIEEGRLAVGDLLPSETVLTETWKVSRMTAHRAMQELQRKGLVTRQRGRGTLVAANAPKSTGNIALLFHNPLDLLEIEYMHGINMTLADEYQLLFCDSHADVEREIRYFQRIQKEADGVICMPSGDSATLSVLRKLTESGFPIVCVDRVPHGIEIDAVISDNFGASVQALQSLVARGHKRIAHFTENEMQISAVRERYEAFIHVMRETGEPNPERLVRYFPTGANRTFEGMTQLMHDALFTLLHQPNPPTAVFCLHDYSLAVLLAAIEQLNVKVPDELEILTFHDALTFMPSVSARLHRIVQEPRKMGHLAAELLKKRMEDRNKPAEVIRVPSTIYSLQPDFPPVRQGANATVLNTTPHPPDSF